MIANRMTVTSDDINAFASAIRNKLKTYDYFCWPREFFSALKSLPDMTPITNNFNELIAGTCSYLSDPGIQKLTSGRFLGAGIEPYRYLFYSSCNNILSLFLSKCTRIGPNAGFQTVHDINLPQVESIGAFAFFNASISNIQCDIMRALSSYALCNISTYEDYSTRLSFPNLEYIGNSCFLNATISASFLSFPLVTTVGSYCFKSMNNLNAGIFSLYFPKVQEIYQYGFDIVGASIPSCDVHIGTSNCQLNGGYCFGSSRTSYSIRIFVPSDYYSDYLNGVVGSKWISYSNKLFSE